MIKVSFLARWGVVIAFGLQLAAATPCTVSAQPLPEASGVGIPSFWDPRRRPERPDLSRLSLIRFMTGYDFPPFNYAGPDGNPTGFNVELARLICEELKVQCTMQMRRFDTLIDALAQSRGDAIIASIVPTPDLRLRLDFSNPYYRSPARFVTRRDTSPDIIIPERLEGRKVAVVAGTSHEAYLKNFFTEADIRPYRSGDAARAALKSGEVDYLFGDGTQLAFWLNGTDSDGCCQFRGGPFTESGYFSEGIGIIVKRGNDTLRLAFNWALFRLWEKGRFTDLWLRYFPISPF